MKFSFASLQGKFGQEVLNKYNLSTDTFNSFVLLKDGKLYTRSTAALLMLKQLGGGWKIFYGLMIIPKFIRNWLYNIIARNRYRWFGKRDNCMVPTPDLKDRFLD